MADLEERLNGLAAAVQQLSQQFAKLKEMQNEHAKQLQQTRNALEKLAALDKLEFIEALNDWVSKEKWQAFKKEPR